MPTSTPNYLTVDTLGRVIALFTGGVQINAFEEDYVSPPGDFGSTPSSQQSVSWIDTKLGGITGYVAVRTQVSQISTLETKRIATLSADSNSPNNVTPGTIPAQAQLQATGGNYANPGGPPRAAVLASWDPSVTPFAVVRAIAGSINRKIVDSDGASDFVWGNAGTQVLAAPNTVPTGANGSTAFTTTKPGWYTISFQPTGYCPTSGLAFASVYVGIAGGGGVERARTKYFFNTSGDHRTFPMAVSQPMFLPAATNHAWGWTAPTGVAWTQDANDSTLCFLTPA